MADFWNELELYRENLCALLPSHVDPKRWWASTQLAFASNAGFKTKEISKLLPHLMKAADRGLCLGTEMIVFPSGDSLQTRTEYRAVIRALETHPEVHQYWSEVVYESERSSIEWRDGELIHEMATPRQTEDPIVAAYAVVTFHDKTRHSLFVWMDEEDITYARNRSQNPEVWNSRPVQMIKKSTYNRVPDYMEIWRFDKPIEPTPPPTVPQAPVQAPVTLRRQLFSTCKNFGIDPNHLHLRIIGMGYKGTSDLSDEQILDLITTIKTKQADAFAYDVRRASLTSLYRDLEPMMDDSDDPRTEPMRDVYRDATGESHDLSDLDNLEQFLHELQSTEELAGFTPAE